MEQESLLLVISVSDLLPPAWHVAKILYKIIFLNSCNVMRWVLQNSFYNGSKWYPEKGNNLLIITQAEKVKGSFEPRSVWPQNFCFEPWIFMASVGHPSSIVGRLWVRDLGWHSVAPSLWLCTKLGPSAAGNHCPMTPLCCFCGFPSCYFMRWLINVEKTPGRSLLGNRIGDVWEVPAERKGIAGGGGLVSSPIPSPSDCSPLSPELGDSALVRRAKSEFARGNQTILIYQTVKILSLQLRR